MNKFYVIIAALALCVGCRGQVPPTNHVVNLSWVAASGCSAAAPCQYIVSRATVSSGTLCPTPNTTTPNYTPLNATSPTSATAYTDTTAAGLNVCYIAQTQQGTAVSVPSNTVFLSVPANPLAPALQAPTVAKAEPALPQPTVSSGPVQLVAEISGKR